MKKMKKVNTRMKYASLLQNLQKEDGNKVEGDMEITFIPGLEENVAKLVSQTQKEKEEGGESVFEQYLRKRKEKKKERRSQKKP